MGGSGGGHRAPPGALDPASISFIPLCGDSSGAWGTAVRSAINTFLERFDVERGPFRASWWRQLLSIGLQHELAQFPVNKFLANVGGEGVWPTGHLPSADADIDLLPAGGWGGMPSPDE